MKKYIILNLIHPTLELQQFGEGQRSVEHLEVEYMLLSATFLHERGSSWRKHLFSPTPKSAVCFVSSRRHGMPRRNRLAFTLSIYAGLRVGEIAALTVGDVATAESRVRREIKLGAHQTKGSKGRTVVLANRVRKEIEGYLRTRSNWRNDSPLDCIAAQWAGIFDGELVDAFQGNLRDGWNSHIVSFRTTDICHSLECKGVGMRTIQKLMGHRNIGTTALYCDVC